MRFTTTVRGLGNNTGIVVPPSVVEELGRGKRAPVRITVGGHTYRSSLAVMGGEHLVSLSKANRTAAGVGAGDEIEVEIEVDDEPREVAVPADLAEALAADPAAQAAFERLPYSHRQRHVLAIDEAKAPETRARRVAAAVAMLRKDS
jgi:hypothetical protein